MTEVEYRALTAACDALLRAPPVTPEKVAVSWLHVLNEHPSILRWYGELFVHPGSPAVAKGDLRRLRGIAGTVARSLWNPGSDPAAGPVRFPGQVDVLFMSHLVSAQTDPDSMDFYYGKLPEELASQGLSTLVALQDHVLEEDPTRRVRLTRGGITSRVVLPRWSTFSQEIRMLLRARLAALALRNCALAAPTALQRAVAREAARNAMTGSTVASLRVRSAVMRLCARFRPRALIVLWEGHAWERLAIHAARSIDPTVRCIGYQHTILFPRAHALRRSLGEGYDPDVILTIGEVNRGILQASDELRGIPVITYGSHRRAGFVKPRAVDASTRCLVIPEGIESECMALFEFALTAAVRLPSLQFVLRTHPVLPFEWLARRQPRLRTLPANVSVSDQADIAADFATCDWALYRGSSSAVHAVLAGVRPVYVECPGEMSIDPLYALEDWRRHVTTVEKFCNLVAADKAAASDHRHREWEPARAFCDRYVVAPDLGIVRRLLTD